MFKIITATIIVVSLKKKDILKIEYSFWCKLLRLYFGHHQNRDNFYLLLFFLNPPPTKKTKHMFGEMIYFKSENIIKSKCSKINEHYTTPSFQLLMHHKQSELHFDDVLMVVYCFCHFGVYR